MFMELNHRRPWFPVVLVLAVWLACGKAVAAQDHSAIRPGFGGAADEIAVAIGLLDIERVDNQAQVFTVDLYLHIQWQDPRLAADGDDVSEFRTFALSEIWTPNLTIVNDRGLDILFPEVATVDRQGNVVLRQRLAGPLAADLDLREFPFDTQRLTVDIISYRYAPDELVFSSESQMIAEPDNLRAGGWTFAALEPEMSIFRLSESGRGSSQLTFAVIAKREAGYYAITLALPMTLILILAWLVHWLPPDLVPARMGMASATVFSLIALGVSFRLSMPEIGYLTTADQFVLYSTLLLIASLAVTVVSVRRVNSDDVDGAIRLTRQARWAFPFLYMAILVALAV
jgi:hypothetical protein